jgi:hypothetical protein
MFIFLILIAAILLALLRGGNLLRMADLEIRWKILILGGFLLQVVVFSNFWQANDVLKNLAPPAYLLSLFLLMIALAKNYRVPGMIFLGLGFLSNSITIALNGGFMPASPFALEAAGMPPLAPGQTSNNSIGMGPNTVLWFLGDIFAIPRGMPLPNIFSIGDVLIAIGAVYLIQKVMVPSTR